MLQVRDGSLYRARAQGQQESLQEIRGQRGRVFFRHKEHLAVNKRQNVVYFLPEAILADSAISSVFSEIMEEDFSGLINQGAVRRVISDQQMAAVKKLHHPLLNQIDEQLVRFYPQGLLAAHVIGFVGGYQVGQYGLEEYYESVLRGESGLTRQFNFLNLSATEPEFNPEPGHDLYLTIDYNIQFQAERLLEEAKERWDITGGTIIVSDPGTGKILAMANYPSFDPNYYGRYGQEDMRRFINPATQNLYEPGSIFKVFTLAAGLNEDRVTPETVYNDTGSVSVGGPPIYNYRRRVWGIRTMTEVLNKSINTGSVFVQQELGRDLFLKYVDLFGFTRPTGIDLAGESYSGNQVLKRGFNRDLATASFGQGVAVTSIQLISAINTLANDGILMKPYIVERQIDQNGSVKITQPEEVGRVIDPRVANQITMMMVEVVNHGYGNRAQVPGYLIAGKTGTAQIPKPEGDYLEETIHGFAGYGPALDPAFSALIKFDAPKARDSSGTAAPIFQELAQYILNYYQIAPETSQ